MTIAQRKSETAQEYWNTSQQITMMWCHDIINITSWHLYFSLITRHVHHTCVVLFIFTLSSVSLTFLATLYFFYSAHKSETLWYVCPHVKCLLFSYQFNQHASWSTDFITKNSCLKFHKHPSRGYRVLPCRLWDMTKLGHFSNCFVKMPQRPRKR